MRIAVDLLSAVLELVLLSYFCREFFTPKFESKMIKVISGVAFVCTNLVVSTFAIDTTYAPILFVCSVFGYSFFYKTKTIKRSLYILMFYVLGIIFEIFAGVAVSTLNDVSIADVQSNIYFYALCLILSKLLLLALFRIIGICMTEKAIKIDGKTVLPILLFEISSIVSIYYFAMIAYKANNFMTSIEVFAIIIIVLFANISTFYLLENQLRLQKSKNELVSLQSQYELQKDYYWELRENMIAASKNTHDIKNFIAAISTYIDTEKNDLAKAKIEEFYGKIPIATKMYTDNMAVNALIYSKIKDILETIPSNEISIIIPDELHIDEIDLCILLGNAIDNAIEGCAKIPEMAKRNLIVKVFPINNQLSILIENARVPQPIPHILFDATQKEEFMHGFGIQNMKNIVDRYEGNMVIERPENRFIVSVLLPNCPNTHVKRPDTQ